MEDDLDLRKNIASELGLAYKYLASRHPECLSSAAEQHIPSYANIVILARQSTRLSEDVMTKLDQELFAGTMKRRQLKEAIAKELAGLEESGMAQDRHYEQAGQPAHLHSQEILNTLTEFFKATNLEALGDEIRLVFDDWDEAARDDRRQLLGHLCWLIDQLQEIQRQVGELLRCTQTSSLPNR